jgi:hypothetical protein
LKKVFLLHFVLNFQRKMKKNTKSAFGAKVSYEPLTFELCWSPDLIQNCFFCIIQHGWFISLM